MHFDRNGFIRRNLAGSYTPSPDTGNSTPFVDALWGPFEKCARDGLLTVPMRPQSYLGPFNPCDASVLFQNTDPQKTPVNAGDLSPQR